MSTEMTKRNATGSELQNFVRGHTAATEPDVARAVAEVQGAMVIAKRFPRDEQAAIDAIKNACTREGLAKRALYSYARGGTDITGPSIRLAEAIAMHWGNLQFGLREIEQRDGESTVEAFAWDVQTNTRRTMLFQVPHVRATKQGRTRLTDPRDIYEMVANQGARRVRACILSIVPGDVVEEAVEQAKATLSTTEAVTPEKVKAMMEAFEELGVSREMVEAFIQRRIEAITPAQVVRLRSIYTSITDGMSKPGDWFEAPEAKPAEKPAPAQKQPTPMQQQAAAIREEIERRETVPGSDGMTGAELVREIEETIAPLGDAKRDAFHRQAKKVFGVKIEAGADVAKLQSILSMACDWAADAAEQK